MLLCPQLGETQSDADTLARMRACGPLERNRDRLACFDRALAAERAEPLATAAEEPVVPESTGDAASSASTDPIAPQPANDRREQPRVVTIVDVTADRPGEARFLTEAGQVYIQTSGRAPSGGYPDVPFEATLEGGALGSVFLAVGDRRRVRVTLAD